MAAREESCGLLCVHGVHRPARWDGNISIPIQWFSGVPVVGLEIFWCCRIDSTTLRMWSGAEKQTSQTFLKDFLVADGYRLSLGLSPKVVFDTNYRQKQLLAVVIRRSFTFQDRHPAVVMVQKY